MARTSPGRAGVRLRHGGCALIIGARRRAPKRKADRLEDLSELHRRRVDLIRFREERAEPEPGRDARGSRPGAAVHGRRGSRRRGRGGGGVSRNGATRPRPQRGAVLFRAMAILDKEKEDLARLLTREEGKTFKESLGEVQRSVNILEYIAAEGRRMGGQTIPSELPSNFCYTLRHPLGVVACITPWNFPVAIPIWKIAPALVSGNTVVFKPATLTPDTASAVVSIFERAGLPKGVLNLILGSGSAVGNAILDHDAVRAVSFTGSNEVGAGIYARGAARMIRVQAEMGGKNPVVVLPDADLDLAVESTATGAFGSTGQRCTATSRVIVDEQIADAFVERLAARARKVRVGNGLEGAEMGPGRRSVAARHRPALHGRGQGRGRAARDRRAAPDRRRPRPRLLRRAHGLRRRHDVDADRAGGGLRPARRRDPHPRLRRGRRGRERGSLRPVGLDLHERQRQRVPLRRPHRGGHRPHQQRHARRRGAAPLRRHQGHGRRARASRDRARSSSSPR